MARSYEKRTRAAREAETRLRITEAAVRLHETLGPARTTVAELARRAGVSRVTVYNHFPDDASLLAACSAHWAERHPAPDPSSWRLVEDDADRLVLGLRELYEWYDANEAMLVNSERDAALVPALAELRARRTGPFREAMLAALTPEARPERQALVAVALELRTWQALCRRGLSPGQSAELMSRAAAAA
jgi:AcrR family transcriptional regulator